jgi:hypothetical protein
VGQRVAAEGVLLRRSARFRPIWHVRRARAARSLCRFQRRRTHHRFGDEGEAPRRRVFAGGLTLTDPAHQTRLERQREKRRLRHQVEVEIRPLSRYDELIPA